MADNCIALVSSSEITAPESVLNDDDDDRLLESRESPAGGELKVRSYGLLLFNGRESEGEVGLVFMVRSFCWLL